MRAARRALGPLAGLASLLAGIALGALLPRELAWVGPVVRAGFSLLIALAPFIILVTLVPALLGLLRTGAAARFALAVVAAFVVGTALAGLLAIVLSVPLFQLPLVRGSTAGSGFAAFEGRTFLATLTSQPFLAIGYAALVALLLHAGARTRLGGFCVPTARVFERAGLEGVQRLGRALLLAMPPLLFLLGVFIPTGVEQALAGGRGAASQGATLGAGGIVASYFTTVLVHVGILAVVVAGGSLLVARATGFSLRRLARDYLAYVYPFAWATASSAATIPVNLERARAGLGTRPEVADFIVPLGATVNRHGSMVSAVVLAVVASLLVGYRPSLLDLLVLWIPLTLVITGAPPVPAGTAVVAPPVVVSVLPIPPEAQAAFVALYFAFGVGLTDQFRTGVNAVSNGLLCVLFERWYPRLARAQAPAAVARGPAPRPRPTDLRRR